MTVNVVDQAAEQAAEGERQEAMKSFARGSRGCVLAAVLGHDRTAPGGRAEGQDSPGCRRSTRPSRSTSERRSLCPWVLRRRKAKAAKTKKKAAAEPVPA